MSKMKNLTEKLKIYFEKSNCNFGALKYNEL
jgi:hypothetical protein